MPAIIKKSRIQFKDKDGNAILTDAVAEQTTAELTASMRQIADSEVARFNSSLEGLAEEQLASITASKKNEIEQAASDEISGLNSNYTAKVTALTDVYTQQSNGLISKGTEVKQEIVAKGEEVKTEIQVSFANKIDEPEVEGISGQVLTTDGAGGRTWTTVSSNNDSSFTETDPTVPSWAKEETKPSYSASEISFGATTVAEKLTELSTKPSYSASEISYNSSTVASTLSSIQTDIGNVETALASLIGS